MLKRKCPALMLKMLLEIVAQTISHKLHENMLGFVPLQFKLIAATYQHVRKIPKPISKQAFESLTLICPQMHEHYSFFF